MPIVYTIVITKNTIDAPSLIYISFTKYLFFQAFTFKKNNTIIKKINIIKILSNIDYPPKNNHYTNPLPAVPNNNAVPPKTNAFVNVLPA